MNKIDSKYKKFGILISIISVLVISTFIVVFSPIPIGHITITPKNYQLKFAIWSSFRYNDYNTVQKESLNRNNVTIICGADCNGLDGKNAVIDNMILWNNSYPNVKFRFSAYGNEIDGSFVWDGNAETIITKLENIIITVVENNLTNVEGINIDLENPVYIGGINNTYMIALPDEGRHQQSMNLWNEFFEWKNSYAPNLKSECVSFMFTSIDRLDGDFDLHDQYSYSGMNLHEWNYYAPMLYKSPAVGSKPYGNYSDPFIIENQGNQLKTFSVDTTYEYYYKLQDHRDAILLETGSLEACGITLGITNQSAYGGDMNVYEFGEYLGQGFDVLIRDTLIAKHFNLSYVSYFAGFTFTELGYILGAFFEEYGDNAFDVINDAVNVNPPVFQIHIGKLWLYLSDVELTWYKVLDFMFNVQNIWFVYFAGLIIIITLVRMIRKRVNETKYKVELSKLIYNKKAINFKK